MPPDSVPSPLRPASFSRDCLVAVLALGAATASQAWDAERMQAAALRSGPRAAAAVAALQPLLRQLSAADDARRLRSLNQFFNRRIDFSEDIDAWGQVDHWASPLEALQKGEGDCEDYAVAKYLGLLAAGTAAHRLRLVYVRAANIGPNGESRAHMVLAYYATPESDPLILDNLIDAIRPAAHRPDLKPVFSFNSEGLWEGTSGSSAGDPLRRLSRWRRVLQKAREEGFL